MTGIWPGKTKCVVMLSFDFDGTSPTLNRNPEAANRPTVLSQGEFGPRVGIFRILDLLERYKIPASFFVPAWNAERNEDTVRDIVRRGHEIGHHGYMHEPPASLSAEEETAILDKGTEILQGITGERPLGYRSPSWDLTEHSIGFLAERGFVYDSSLMGHDAPYFVDSPNGRLVELPVSWALDDAPYYAFNRGGGSMNTPGDVYKAWEWEFDGAYQYGSAFILTMHPMITGRLARMMVRRGSSSTYARTRTWSLCGISTWHNAGQNKVCASEPSIERASGENGFCVVPVTRALIESALTGRAVKIEPVRI